MMKLILIFLLPLLLTAAGGRDGAPKDHWKEKVMNFRRTEILKHAAWAIRQKPETITAFLCPRSPGNKHEFYSEGDYWWPDPKNPEGPYIQRDGETNPGNFVAHRQAMIRFSIIVGDLAAAYILTHDKKYVTAALKHINAWFVDTATLMYPELQYAQAIHGITKGRGIGIIDTIQLIEVARAIYLFEEAGLIPREQIAAIRSWFAEYLHWLLNSKNGKDEMNAKNNHGTCWVMQAAVFARVTRDTAVLDLCRNRYEQVLLPDQMAANGSFPFELRRTKPYGYSIFNLDALSTICQTLSDNRHDLWNYTTPDGKSIRKGIDFLFPYLKDKSKWPYAHDVMHWESWPVAQPSLLFGAAAFGDEQYFQEWKKLNHDPQDEEIIRNLPVRHPLIWLN